MKVETEQIGTPTFLLRKGSFKNFVLIIYDFIDRRKFLVISMSFYEFNECIPPGGYICTLPNNTKITYRRHVGFI